jgi:hypothetical protein
MTEILYYILIIVECLFDQQPSYTDDMYAQGLVFTPWSSLPFIRLHTVEILMGLVVMAMLVSSKYRGKKNGDNAHGLVIAQILFASIVILGEGIGCLRFGFISMVFFQARGLIHAGILFFITTKICADQIIRRRTIQLLFFCASLKAFQGVYFLITGGYGRTLPDGTPLIFYDQTATMLMVVVVLMMFYSYIELSRFQKTVTLLSLLPAIVSFVLSYRRNLYLGVAFALAVLMLQNIFKNPARIKKLVFPLIVIVFVGVVSVALFLPDKYMDIIKERVGTSFQVEDAVTGETDQSNFFRLIEAVNVWENYKSSPIVGAGFGGRYDIIFFPPGMNDTFIQDVNYTVHDSYLYILYKTGAIGLIMFLCALGLIIKSLHIKTKIDFGIIPISYFIFLVFIISCFFMPTLYIERNISFPNILIALSYCSLQNITIMGDKS